MLGFVETGSSERAGVEATLPVGQQLTAALNAAPPAEALSPSLILQLWKLAEAEAWEITPPEFARVLERAGTKVNYGSPPEAEANLRQKESFLRALHLTDLALAQACARGMEAAWERFLKLYRNSLIETATKITGSASLGEELADALYAELYGLRERDGERKSPLESYSGRGSLLSWLRATLVQRHRDHWRSTHRETPIDDFDCPAPAQAYPVPGELTALTGAIGQILQEISAADRFLLAAYYLDGQTLGQIGRTLDVHEATISRRLKRVAADLRDMLLGELHRRGLSKAAAKDALGADPRDLEINMRALLQTSQTTPFSVKGGQRPTGDSEPV